MSRTERTRSALKPGVSRRPTKNVGGPIMNVTRCRSISWSACSGSQRAMSTAFMPPTPATVTAFWRPEMWASGAGISTTSSAVSPCTCDHRAPPSRPGRRGCAAPPSARRSTPRCAAPGRGPRARRNPARTGSPSSTSAGTSSGSTTRSGPSRASSASTSAGPARWWIGAATAPSRQQARYSARASQRLVACQATVLPWPTPCARSEPASRATASCERVRDRGRPRRRRRWRGPHPAPRRASVRAWPGPGGARSGARLMPPHSF